ncbi:hypothetical protein ACQY0O_005207 [Thecaphora frezii]
MGRLRFPFAFPSLCLTPLAAQRSSSLPPSDSSIHLLYTVRDLLAIQPLQTYTYDWLVQAGNLRYFGALLAVKTAVARGYLSDGRSVVLTT